MARILKIDDAAKRRAAEIVAYAEMHPYVPGNVPLPADVPNHIAVFEHDFRAVFSLTHLHDKIFRHLTVASEDGRVPPPFAVLAIADLFGFTGRGEAGDLDIPDDWMMRKCECCNNVVVAQVVHPPSASSSSMH